MPMYNLTEQTNNQSKISGNLWEYCRGKLAVYDNGGIIESNKANITKQFGSRAKLTDRTGTNSREDVEIMISLKYLSNFRRTLKTPLLIVKLTLFNLVCMLFYIFYR